MSEANEKKTGDERDCCSPEQKKKIAACCPEMVVRCCPESGADGDDVAAKDKDAKESCC